MHYEGWFYVSALEAKCETVSSICNGVGGLGATLDAKAGSYAVVNILNFKVYRANRWIRDQRFRRSHHPQRIFIEYRMGVCFALLGKATFIHFVQDV